MDVFYWVLLMAFTFKIIKDSYVMNQIFDEPKYKDKLKEETLDGRPETRSSPDTPGQD
jgi:hypothetical protein